MTMSLISAADTRTQGQTAVRADLQAISSLVRPESLVLDLGCGEGLLLDHLAQTRHVQGRGIELHEAGVMACIRRGLSVCQGNLNDGLGDYPDQSMDYVILSQTLPYLNNPQAVMEEMLRVGRQAIISIPNWGYWKSRLSLLLTGHIPQAPALPEAWHAERRWQALTISDFIQLCQARGIRLEHAVYLVHDRPLVRPVWANLLATTGIFALQK